MYDDRNYFINGRLPMCFIDIKTFSLTFIGEGLYKCVTVGIISSMVDHHVFYRYQNSLFDHRRYEAL